MPDREPPPKTSSLRDWGSALLARFGWPRNRKTPLSSEYEKSIKVLLLLALSLAIAVLLAPHPQKSLGDYKVGAIAQENIRAVGDYLVEDTETTQKRQREILAALPPVFDLDEQVAEKIETRLHRGLEYMRKVSREATQELTQTQENNGFPKKPSFAELYPKLLQHKPEFDEILGTKIPTPTFQLLAKAEFSPALEALIVQVLDQVYRQGVIASRGLLQLNPKKIILRHLPSGEEQLVQAPFSFLMAENLRKPMANYCREIAGDFSPAERLLVCDMIQHLAAPNISLNLAETRERQEKSLEDLSPTFYQVKRGELILREGERVTPLHLSKLKAQNASYTPQRSFLIFLGSFLSLIIILWLAYNLARISLKNFSTRVKDLVFLAVLILVCLLANYGLVSLAAILAPLKPLLGKNLIYAIPIGLGPICAALFLGLETGLAMAFLMATLTALLLHKPFPMFLYLLSGSLMGIWGVRAYRLRRSLISAGLAICGINLVMVTAFKLLEYPFTGRDVLLGEVFAVSGGLLTGILALGLIPIIETVFWYTSNTRILELLNLDQPLLKELMLVAPGTYHHSLVVGQMVEAAAEAIGANPLLAKAAAYYHDIGKVKKPAYFVENQFGGENKHEKLAPSMSSLILTAHVKDGVELARKQQLGEDICDIIQQHHGTCLISYFYTKARNQASNPDKVNIDDYRYPGPRPQTKEAGLVLVADQVEAASKTLTDPTPARIQGMVQKIINNIFADGQLNECELTLKELNLIAKHCNKILSGIFHHRVTYPAPAEKTRVNGDLDKQPPKKNGPKSGNGPKKSQEDLRRLGMG
ncbi:MAG: HDIG domain-containing protein [Syntrophobacterales bacterium]|jgi:putative nucleotidyltransferase with HDIG domain